MCNIFCFISRQQNKRIFLPQFWKCKARGKKYPFSSVCRIFPPRFFPLYPLECLDEWPTKWKKGCHFTYHHIIGRQNHKKCDSGNNWWGTKMENVWMSEYLKLQCKPKPIITIHIASRIFVCFDEFDDKKVQKSGWNIRVNSHIKEHLLRLLLCWSGWGLLLQRWEEGLSIRTNFFSNQLQGLQGVQPKF